MVDRLSKWVNSLTAAAPKGPEMRELTRRHDAWMRTAETGRTYFSPDAYFEWQGYEHDPRLVLVGGAVFTDRSRDRLYTDCGSDSLALFHQWGGITDKEPPRPARPTRPDISGRLQDWDHPERWTIKTVQL